MAVAQIKAFLNTIATRTRDNLDEAIEKAIDLATEHLRPKIIFAPANMQSDANSDSCAM
ncbi:MAG: hypothetical protein HRT36_04415 [Alphaproteobacteria bacterium]|nr:hypothetical protein [Alphaproteobacteria bacterium]